MNSASCTLILSVPFFILNKERPIKPRMRAEYWPLFSLSYGMSVLRAGALIKLKKIFFFLKI